jgi:uncharacterized protein with GYD domain
LSAQEYKKGSVSLPGLSALAQGRYDVVTIVEAPDESSAMSLNLSLGALGNVRTETMRAFSAAEMTQIVGKMI